MDYTCERCAWFAHVKGRLSGNCRRRSPGEARWPVVLAHDWCGDFLPGDEMLLSIVGTPSDGDDDAR